MKTDNIRKMITDIYVCIMFVLFPLFFTNKYINIVQSKRFFFDVVTITYIIAVSFIMITFKTRFYIDKTSCVFLTILGMSVVVSTICSSNSFNSFFAFNKRMLGGMIIILCIVIYIMITINFSLKKWMVWVFEIVNIFMFILIILDNWQIDVLNMKSNLVSSQYNIFTGTLGNINVNASYLALIVPAIISISYLTGVKKCTKWIVIVSFVATALSIAACVCVRSNSVYLALIATIIAIIGCSLVAGRGCDICAYLIVTAALSLKVVGIMYEKFCDHAYEFDNVNLLVCNGPVPIILIIAACIMFAVYILNKMKIIENTRILFWGFMVLVGTGLLLLIVMFIVANCGRQENMTGVLRHFYISDSFGNNRGYVWSRTIKMIKNEGIVNAVTGSGMNEFANVFSSYFYEEMSEKFDASFIDAHNEFLQFMVMTGIIGCIGYFGIMISILVKSMKKLRDNSLSIVGITVISSYLMQGLVNNPQVFTFPLLFVFMGVMNTILTNSNNQEK